MPGLRLTLEKRHPLWVAVALLCCVLVTLAGVAQVAHSHAGTQAVHADCALCHTAHLGVQLPVPQALPLTVWVMAGLPAAPRPLRRQRFSVFSLFTRPPPVDRTFA